MSRLCHSYCGNDTHYTRIETVLLAFHRELLYMEIKKYLVKNRYLVDTYITDDFIPKRFKIKSTIN